MAEGESSFRRSPQFALGRIIVCFQHSNVGKRRPHSLKFARIRATFVGRNVGRIDGRHPPLDGSSNKKGNPLRSPCRRWWPLPGADWPSSTTLLHVLMTVFLFDLRCGTRGRLRICRSNACRMSGVSVPSVLMNAAWAIGIARKMMQNSIRSRRSRAGSGGLSSSRSV